jgi:hypothetical protein
MTYQAFFWLVAGFKEPDLMIAPIFLLAATYSAIDIAFLPQVNNGKVVGLCQPTITYIKSHASPG